MSDNSMIVTANPIPVDMTVDAEYHVYPEYHGDTQVLPTENYRVLYTKDKLVRNNIIVDPIPEYYGRVNYSGGILRIF